MSMRDSKHFNAIAVTAAGAIAVGIAGGALAWAWPSLPERIATHWDAQGVADGFTDRGPALIAMSIGIPVAIAAVLSIVMGMSVGRSVVGRRYLLALPAGLLVTMLMTIVGSIVMQRDGGDASTGALIVGGLAAGAAMTLGLAQLLRPTPPLPDAGSLPPDADRLANDDTVWWTGNARPSPPLAGLLIAVTLLPLAIAIIAPSTLWVVLLVTAVTTLVIVAMITFRVTIGAEQLVVAGSVFGWPRTTIPLRTIRRADRTHVSMWKFGGVGIRYGKNSTGYITRGGEALEIERSDGSLVVITCDDADTAARAINTNRAARHTEEAAS